MAKFIDLTGQIFGRWTVLRYEGKQRFWCRCVCGAERSVKNQGLREGRSQSCGCHHKEVIGAIRRRHGLYKTRLYHIWQGMIQRCCNPKNKRFLKYGPRGICTEWREDFVTFYTWAMTHGYRKHLTIDRIDNTLGYAPDNCRWIMMSEQYLNLAKTSERTSPSTHLSTDQSSSTDL